MIFYQKTLFYVVNDFSLQKEITPHEQNILPRFL